MSPKISIIYFDVAGKAEPTRLLAAHGGMEIDDIRLSRDEFVNWKTAGVVPEVVLNLIPEEKRDPANLALPFGQLPVMLVQSEKTSPVLIGQSAAQIQFLGTLVDAVPACPVQAAIANSLIDQENDMFTGYYICRYHQRFGFGDLSPENLDGARDNWSNAVLPTHLGFFENYLKKSTSGWLAGTENPSIADFAIAPRMLWLAECVVNPEEKLNPKTFESYPGIVAWVKKFYELPAVQKYYGENVPTFPQ